MDRIRKWIGEFRSNEKAQGMVEYGLILALVTVVAIGGLTGIGDAVENNFENVVGSVVGSEKVSDREVDRLVSDGYLVVASSDDILAIGNDEARTWGLGTRWEYEGTKDDNHLGAKFIQVQDIDLAGVTDIEPIGLGFDVFTGTFDGGNFSINNLTMNRETKKLAGLFGMAHHATFKDIHMENVKVNGSEEVGGLVGHMDDSSKIVNSSVTGNISGVDSVGGLAGSLGVSSITNSHVRAVVTGERWVGGLVGRQSGSKLSNSYSLGQVSGSVTGTGGLVGIQESSSEISNSFTTCKVSGEGDIGALLGGQANSSVVDSGWMLDVNGEMVGVGRTVAKPTDTPKINTKGYSQSEIHEIISTLIK